MAEPDIKRLPISEFRERGYLHEVNRLLLHPLGLALEVSVVAEPGVRISLRQPDHEEAIEALTHVIARLPAGSFDRESLKRLLGTLTQRAERYEAGDTFLGGVWDCQDDPGGVAYGEDLLSPEKAKAVVGEMMDRRGPRIKTLGYVIQPIPDERVLTTNYTDPEAEPTRTQHVPGIGDVEFES